MSAQLLALFSEGAATVGRVPPLPTETPGLYESSRTTGRVWGVRASLKAHGTLRPTHAPGMYDSEAYGLTRSLASLLICRSLGRSLVIGA